MSAVLSKQVDEIISYNPATGEEVGRVPVTSAEDVQAAVVRAREAFQGWRKTSFAERKRLGHDFDGTALVLGWRD